MNLVAAVEWAEGYNRRGLYSPIGVAFHWVMAALMIFQLAYGWYLGWQPVGGDKYLGYQTHTEVGLTIMLLGTLRLFWYSQIAGPDNVDGASLAGKASSLLQTWFYVSFFALPISGWVMWSTLPGDLPQRILASIAAVLKPGRRYIQFTYSERAWRRFATPGLKQTARKRVWMNVPPAVVLTFERTAP